MYSIFQQIDQESLKFSEESQIILKESILRVKNKIALNDKKNIVFVGLSDSGKSGLINSILLEICKIKSELLTTSKSGGNFYTTIIESSSQSTLSIIIERNNEEIMNSSNLSADEVHERLDEYSEKQSDMFRNIIHKESSATSQDKINVLDEEIPNITVKIQVPGLKSDLRLIECPDQSSEILNRKFFRLLNEKYVPSLFVFVRNMCQQSVGGGENIWVRIKKEYPNSLMCVCLTKYDLFLEKILAGTNYYKPISDKNQVKRTNDAMKFKDKIVLFLEDLEKTNVQIIGLFILNNNNNNDENDELSDNQKKNINNFIDFLIKFLEENKNYISNLNTNISMINILPGEIKNYVVKTDLSEIEKEEILKKFHFLSVFKENLKQWKNNFPSNFGDFKDHYGPELIKIRINFNINDVKVSKKFNKYFNKQAYIKEQFLLNTDVMNNLVNKELNDVLIKSIDPRDSTISSDLSNNFKKQSSIDFKYVNLNSKYRSIWFRNNINSFFLGSLLTILILLGKYLRQTNVLSSENIHQNTNVSISALSNNTLNNSNTSETIMLNSTLNNTNTSETSILNNTLNNADSVYVTFFKGPLYYMIENITYLSLLIFVISMIYKPLRNYFSYYSDEKCFLEMLDSFYEHLSKNLYKIISNKLRNIEEKLIQSDEFNQLKKEQQTNKFTFLTNYLNKKLYENNLTKKEKFSEIFKYSLNSIHVNFEEKDALNKIFFND